MLMSLLLRRRKSELINPNFKVVSLHTAKEVSDLYMHTKSAAEIENERRPWRRLKRTALRDAEALAESVLGMPAEDLRRRFRGVIGRRVLVTLSAIADMDASAPELQAMAQDNAAVGAVAAVGGGGAPLLPAATAPAVQADALVSNSSSSSKALLECSQPSPGESLLQLVRSTFLPLPHASPPPPPASATIVAVTRFARRKIALLPKRRQRSRANRGP